MDYIIRYINFVITLNIFKRYEDIIKNVENLKCFIFFVHFVDRAMETRGCTTFAKFGET